MTGKLGQGEREDGKENEFTIKKVKQIRTGLGKYMGKLSRTKIQFAKGKGENLVS